VSKRPESNDSNWVGRSRRAESILCLGYGITDRCREVRYGTAAYRRESRRRVDTTRVCTDGQKATFGPSILVGQSSMIERDRCRY
jgi:hypothetical protein